MGAIDYLGRLRAILAASAPAALSLQPIQVAGPAAGGGLASRFGAGAGEMRGLVDRVRAKLAAAKMRSTPAPPPIVGATPPASSEYRIVTHPRRRRAAAAFAAAGRAAISGTSAPASSSDEEDAADDISIMPFTSLLSAQIAEW